MAIQKSIKKQIILCMNQSPQGSKAFAKIKAILGKATWTCAFTEPGFLDLRQIQGQTKSIQPI